MNDSKKRLMRIKKQINKKRPKFKRFESWRFIRIKDHWRKPRGIDNKMRTEESGWPKSVKVGWRSPALVRYLHPIGKEEVMIWNPKDLDKVNPDSQVARIGGSVGGKKREKIVDKAFKNNVRLLNPGIEVEHEVDLQELEDDKK